MSSLTKQDIKQAILLLRNSKNEDEIIAAIDILGAIRWVGAVPYIMHHLKDSRPEVRTAVEAALLSIGQDGIPAIVEYIPKLESEHHIGLQSIVESFWKDAEVDQIRQLMNHADNRVRWAMAWTLAKPLKTIPPENIEHVFAGLEVESVAAIRWAATQSVMTLASSDHEIPVELIQVALPVMVDNFKYGDVNLSESSVRAISLLVSPPHPAITAMLTSSDDQLQVAAVKVLTAWVEDETPLDQDTVSALKLAMKASGWQLANEVSRLRYALSFSYPDILNQLEALTDSSSFDENVEPTQTIRPLGNIMLPPLDADDE